MTISKNKTKEFLKIAFPAILESLVSVIIATIDTKMIACQGKPAIPAGFGVEGFWSAAIISQGIWFVMAGAHVISI